VKGFVLAAGFGERLRPLTEALPKPLFPVGNLPLIGYALKLLAHHGITDVVVNLHHLGRPLREQLGDGGKFGVQITYSEEEEILGTGGGLKRMHEHFSDDSFVVLNSDTIVDVDLTALLAAHRKSGALATMVLREDPQQERYGQIEIDSTGQIRKLLGQGEADEPLRALMFAGVHVLEPRFLDYIPPDIKTCVVRYAYAKALQNREPLYGVTNDGYWADAGTPARYLQVNRDALDRLIKLDHADPLQGFALSPKKEVAEVVRMGEGVQLGSGALIVPPVLLGDGTRVGDNAKVGPYAVVGARCHIGKEAQVSNTVVLEGAKIEAGTQVANAVVGKKGILEAEAEA